MGPTITNDYCFFNNFLLIDPTDRSTKISSDQKHLFFALSLYPLSFFANTPFKSLFKIMVLIKVGQLTKRKPL